MSIIVMQCLDPADRLSMTAPAGASLAEIVGLALPGAPVEHVRVLVAGHVIERANWHVVRPKPGAEVLVRLLPGDSGALRAVLTIAVAIAAITISGGLLGPLAPGLLAAGQLGASLAGAATLAVGTLLINALVPVRKEQAASGDTSPTYSISGLQNSLNPGGAVPRLLGEMRWAPVYAAKPYTEASGNDRYVIALFCCGYGPLELPEAEMRIGTTPISQYTGVTVEVREGYAGDSPVTLYPNQVSEDAVSIHLEWNAAHVLVTAPDVDRASIDIAFAQGLYAVSKGSTTARYPWGVDFQLRYRKVGDATWTTTTVNVSDNHVQPLIRTHYFTFPERGQYEVEMMRTSINWDDFTADPNYAYTTRSDWVALRGYRPEYPLNFGKPLALVGVKIKATDQLNGTLDKFSVLGRSVLPDWDSVSGTWITRATRNPASHFRHVLTGNAATYPVSVDEMEALEDWHEWCALKGLTYDRIHDAAGSMAEVLADIAAAGRASPQDRGGRWGVVIDRIMDVVRGHISPRNSWGFSGRRPLARLPDAFRVTFRDATNDYEEAERVVPLPDFYGEPGVVEDLALPGITDPDLIYREARRRGYELKHRPDTYEVHLDWEHLANTRGDLVRLSHDVLDRTQVSARVRTVSGSTVTLDEIVTMEAGKAYACRFRAEDGTSILRGVHTAPGETRAISLTGAGPAPAPGDLAMFGHAAEESLECIVKGVEIGDDLTAKLILIDHAPQIEAETDAETPPAWSGRVGAEAGVSLIAPAVPVIFEVLSGSIIGP